MTPVLTERQPSTWSHRAADALSLIQCRQCIPGSQLTDAAPRPLASETKVDARRQWWTRRSIITSQNNARFAAGSNRQTASTTTAKCLLAPTIWLVCRLKLRSRVQRGTMPSGR